MNTKPSNVSLEATWDTPRFAHDGAFLISCGGRVGETPATQLEAVMLNDKMLDSNHGG